MEQGKTVVIDETGGNHAKVSVVGGKISVTPDPLPITARNVVIEWQIVTPGWTFPTWEDGIVLEESHPDFSNGYSDGTGKIYTIRNKNSVKKAHKYTVYLTDGTQTLDLDPNIINQG